MNNIELGTVEPQLHGTMIQEGHLGGFIDLGDGGTYYPYMWSYLVKTYNIKSVLDIGCGRGYSALYFKSLGCNVTGIDGSKQAFEDNVIKDTFVHHDYTLGSSSVTGEYDLGWSCEFVEHVEEKYLPNFMQDFQKCNYIAMTFAGVGQAGHHHVNCNTQDYWIKTLKDYGFDYQQEDTETLRRWAVKDKEDREKIPHVPYFVSHFISRGLFFKKQK
jgi:SAM-dependent methyltransferase